MKLTEIQESNNKKPGTYAGVRFSSETTKKLIQFAKKNKIPNMLEESKLHTTLLYSRKHLPDYQPAGEYNPILVGTPKGWEIWQSQPDDNGERSNILVLTFECPALSQRHEDLMQQHQATFDFDEYKPHVSITYNAGDMDAKDLPKFTDDLEIVEEYHEELSE